MFTRGNKETAKRERVGRPKKMTTTIADVCSADELRALIRKTYERAMNAEATSLAWILTQMPRIDSGFKLPKGLPPLTSLKNLVLAMDVSRSMLAEDSAFACKALRLLKRTTEYCVDTLPGSLTASHFNWSSGCQAV